MIEYLYKQFPDQAKMAAVSGGQATAAKSE
jgi:hypothetical protein